MSESMVLAALPTQRVTILEQSWRPLFLGKQRTSIIGDEPRLQNLNNKRILHGALRSFSR